MRLNKESVLGLNLSSINKWLITLTCLLAAAVFTLTLYAVEKYSEMTGLTREYLRLEDHADTVKAASDYLTNEVHKFLITGDLEHLDAYFEEANVTRRRESAIDELSKQQNISYEDVKAAVDESKELMQREIYAMKLVAVAMGYNMEELPEEIQQTTLVSADMALSYAEQADYQFKKQHFLTDKTSESSMPWSCKSFCSLLLHSISLWCLSI